MKIIGYFKSSFLSPHIVRKVFARRQFDRTNFFLSFEDTLKYVFAQYGINGRKEHCLLPDFYCPDTRALIEKYCTPVFYTIKPDFSVDLDSFFTQIEAYRPKVIILYAYTGFELGDNEKKRLSSFAKDSIIINDCAHRIVNTKQLSFIHDRHFHIDSTRKHSAYLGSHLIGKHATLERFDRSHASALSLYACTCHILQTLRNAINLFAFVLSSKTLYRLAERIFLAVDDSIGNGARPARGSIISFFLYDTLDTDRMRQHHRDLAILYTHHLSKLNGSSIRTLPKHIVEKSEMAYYPLFVQTGWRDPLIEHLEREDIFSGTLWDRNDTGLEEHPQDLYDSFIILPLNTTLGEDDVKKVFNAIRSFIESNGTHRPIQNRHMA